MNKVTISGKEYRVSPLRCKHLKEISKIISSTQFSPQAGTYQDLERWMPFILASLKVNHPDFTTEDLEEMTLQEFTSIWSKVVEISGITVVSKGETPPAEESIGSPSTGGSVPPSAGPTVM